MAVKHKGVECVENPQETRLSVILRTLQSYNVDNPIPISDFSMICERIVYSLGLVTMPTNTEDYVSFMSDIKSIQDILNEACSEDNAMFATLKALYNSISDPKMPRQPTMSIILQLIKRKSIPTAVDWILRRGTPNHHFEALSTLCSWLSRWTLTPNLGILILCFMQGLEAKDQDDIVQEVSLKFIEHLFILLLIPDSRTSVGPVVRYMLQKLQGNREAFFKLKPNIAKVLNSLHKENSESSVAYLEDIVGLLLNIINHFPGDKEIYDDVLPTLESCSPNLKQLQFKTLSNDVVVANPLRGGIGKVGLINLGNTCYMNSVLQALFMTKLFCNDVLLSPQETMPLFSNLRILFALLQYSQKISLPPSEILQLTRPPGFQLGQQHDSSEFLGFLLDALHEQERVGAPFSETGDSEGIAVNGPTVVQKSFGGKSVTVSKCHRCNTQSEHTDYFRDLQLSFPNNSTEQSVQTLLNYYLQPENLCGDNQYHCDACHGLTDGERETRIVEPPARLILTLKYFRFDLASQERRKLLQHVKLNCFVDLKEIQYELYAAVVHDGSSLDSGHYYTFAREGDSWYKFNDIYVTGTTFDELCGVRPPATPYILFYKQKDSDDPGILPQSALPFFLRDILRRNRTEPEDKRHRPTNIYYNTRNKRNDDPPPPGCGGGTFKDNLNSNRYIY